MSRRARRRKRDGLPSAVDSVRQRIEHWRETRTKRTRMPDDLWDAAASVAQEHGLWAVSRALRVNYESLKRRAKATETRGAGVSCAASFVELEPMQLAGPTGHAGATVELSGSDGSKLTIRAGTHEVLDVAALADAFWRRDR